MWPGVTTLSVAGSTTIAGEDRDEQPHPLARRTRAAACDSGASTSVHDVQRDEHRDVARTSAAATRSPSSVTTLTRGSRRCSSPGRVGDVVGEHRLAHARPPPRRASCRRSCPCGGVPMHPHGHRPTSLGSSHVGVAACAAVRVDAVVVVDVAVSSAAAVIVGRARRMTPPSASSTTAIDGDAERARRRGSRPTGCVSPAEVVAVEQGVVPEAGVVVQPVRHRVEVVLLQVEIRRRVLAERAPGASRPSGVSSDHRAEPDPAPTASRAGAAGARSGVGLRAPSAWLMRRTGRLARWR